MLIIPIEEAEVGMKLAADMVHPAKPDQVLLKRGFELDGTVLAKMREFGVVAVYVDYPGLADLDRHLIPSLGPERLRIFGQVKATIAAVQRTAKPCVGFSDYYHAIRGFVLTLFQQGDHPLYLEQMALRMGDGAVAHATAVAHLSLLLGIKLQGYLLEQRKRLPAHHAAEVVNLGIAGMLHDIGKCRLPPEQLVYCATRPPEDADREIWETHPRIGYDMLRGGIEPSAAVAVLHHHQRYRGGGFPDVANRRGQVVNMEGRAIHVFARILAVADLFDQLTHPVGGSKAELRPAFQVLHRIRNEYVSWLDPVVIRALLQVVPPFPPGGRVRLSDGTNAVVTAPGVKDPNRPMVRRFKSNRQTLEDQPLDLGGIDGLEIESVDGVSVAEYMPKRMQNC